MPRIQIWRIPVPPQEAESRAARSRWVWQRAKGVLAETLACPVESLRIARSAGGKPELRRPEGWALALSHSGAFSLLALAPRGPLGIDHEKLRAVNEINAVARDFFGENMVNLLNGLTSAAREKAFFSAWTGLEALLKATGEGFAGSGGNFEAQVFTSAAQEVRRAGRKWRIEALPLRGYAGAIAYPAELGACELRMNALKLESA